MRILNCLLFVLLACVGANGLFAMDDGGQSVSPRAIGEKSSWMDEQDVLPSWPTRMATEYEGFALHAAMMGCARKQDEQSPPRDDLSYGPSCDESSCVFHTLMCFGCAMTCLHRPCVFSNFSCRSGTS